MSGPNTSAARNHNGIDCTDGSVTSLTRVVTDTTSSTANTWLYTRSGIGNITTTETQPLLPYDSAANVKVFTFSNGKVTSEKIYQGAATGTPLRTINTSYATNGTPNVTTTILEDGSKQRKVETDFDSFGNLLESREYGWGTGAPGGLARRTTMTYLTGTGYTTANILNRVTRITVKDGGTTPISRTDITYDSYGSGNANLTSVTGALQHNDSGYGQTFTYRGNPTSITRYTDAATPGGAITTNLFYDTLGNLRKTDVGGVVQTQTAYSSTTQYSFPDSVTQGPSSPQLTTAATYNGYTGLIATSTDPNNQVTNYTYDNQRRLTDLEKPDSTDILYSYDDTNNKITQTTPVQGTDVIKQISALDSLGRVFRTTVADSGGTGYSSTDVLGVAFTKPAIPTPEALPIGRRPTPTRLAESYERSCRTRTRSPTHTLSAR
jgi:YD repeat-containing protein